MEEDEGEYLDDPISLMFNGVTEIVDLATSSDDDDEALLPRSSYGNRSFSLPVTFFDISRNVTLLKKCQPLSIKVVDCGKYPPNKPHSKDKFQVSYDENMISCDDDKVIQAVKETMSINVRRDSKVYNEKPNAETNLNPSETTSCDSRMEDTDREPKEATKKYDTTISKKVEHEKEQALKRKDLSRLDFKKNTGLIGLTITNKIGIKIDSQNKRSKKGKISDEIMKGTTLSNLGTEVIPLTNRNKCDMPKNVTNDSQSHIKSKEASLVSTDANDRIAKSNDNSPTRCSLKIKCPKLLEKTKKLKKAKESHNQEPSKTKSELISKQSTLDTIANDHTVPKLNLKRKQSEADRNVFYIVDSKNKESGCGTKNKTRKLAETKEEDKAVKNQANKDTPALSSSPLLQCTTNINTSNPGKLKDTKLTNTPNRSQKDSEIKCYQKKLQSYTILKQNPKKKNLCTLPECFSVPVNNKSNSSAGSTTVAPKPDELAKIRRERQVQLTKINSDTTIQDAESLSGAGNGCSVQTLQQTPKTKVTKTNDAAIVNSENRTGAKNDSLFRVYQHTPKTNATTLTDAAIVKSENLTGVENDSSVRTYQHTPKNKVTLPTDATIVNENRVTSRVTLPKVVTTTHKQKDAGTPLTFSQNVNYLSPPGENAKTEEWGQPPQPDLFKTVNYATLNRPFYLNHPGNFKGPQLSPLQTSMHQIQGRPIETMINGRPHLYRQPESNALQGRPVRFLGPWPPSPFPPPNTNVTLNASPKMLRPNSQIHRLPAVNSYINYQIPGYCWPVTPPPPPPLLTQQENGTSVTPARLVSKESIIGSSADGNLIKKIMLTSTINDKDKMLETLNSEIDQNLDKVTEEKQEPMQKQTDPRLTAKSKPCPLSKKASNNSIQPMIDHKTRDFPASKTPCNLPVTCNRQAIGIMAKNEKSCPLSKKTINSGQPKIDQKIGAISSYSAPILPTISYQQAFEILAKNDTQKVNHVFKELTTDSTFSNHSKLYSEIKCKKGDKEDQAKKISIEEYKKRIKGTNSVDKNNTTKRKCKNKKVPNKVAVDNNQDLGYDSDATYVL